jgi:hypothetical protein
MWNIAEASDEQREAMLTALRAEQATHALCGDEEQVAAVQASIDLWSKPTRAQLAGAVAAKAAEDARHVGVKLPELHR